MRILVYADLDARLTDGSSIWLASISEVLANLGHEVHVLSKVHFMQSNTITPVTDAHPDLHLHLPQRGSVARTPQQAAHEAARLHQQVGFDIVLVRGFAACFAFAKETGLASRLWSYITDLPFPLEALTPSQEERLHAITGKSHRMFAQTEAARSYLEAVAPSAAGKTLLLPPMVPDEAFALKSDPNPDRLQLVYAGKLAKDWQVLDLLELPGALEARGVAAHLTVIGDKFQHDEGDSSWADRLRERLEAANADPHVPITWRGSMPRTDVLSEIGRADIGIGWRSTALDSSLEISTKALEYSACGTPPLLNDSTDHRSVWGNDYPLFANGRDSVDEVADRIVESRPHLAVCAVDARAAVAEYSMSAAARRLDRQISRGAANGESEDSTAVVIASHDFKFLGELVDDLQQQAHVELRLDAWATLHTHDELESLAISAGADVIFCEWAGPALAWHANEKDPHTRLVTRLHGFELRGPWLASLDVNAVDHWVFVSEHYRALAIEQLGIDPSVTSVIPNMIDADDLHRPKVVGHEFQLGLAGIVGFGKRPDRALNLLSTLLEHDDRYILRVKGPAPWEYPHEWRDALQRQLYLDFYTRIGADQALRDHVVFEPFSPDIASWFRQVGIILSPSHSESFHLAPAEGMASGAVPVIWQRPGAQEIFGTEWLVDDTADAAERILELRDADAMKSARTQALEQSQRWDRDVVLPLWHDVLRLS